MKRWIKMIDARKWEAKHLTGEEASAAAYLLARGEATDAQASAFLVALRMKCESAGELLSFIHVFREYCTLVASCTSSIHYAGPHIGRRYFPITIPVSLLLAAVQIPQVLHGGDSLFSKEGTPIKELLEGLGVHIQTNVMQWEKTFTATKLNFLWTDQFCPPLSKLRSIREEIGLPTILDSMEKIINPLQARNLIVGVDDRKTMQDLVAILPAAGFETSYIVQGVEGSEDLPIFRNTAIRRVTATGDDSSIIYPETFGFASEPCQPLDKQEQLDLMLRVIEGDDSMSIQSERDHVIFNAGLRLYWFEKVATYEEGFSLARSLLQRKEAKKLLEKWIRLSRSRDQPMDAGV